MSGVFSFNFSPYLPPNAKEQLAKYEYHGADRSLIYRYAWKPLCARLVELLPRWLAPNVITVTALAIVCATHAALVWFMPSLTVAGVGADGVAPPPAVFVASGLALFAYQLLDNLDGYQARRTKTSSPLGLLMDHGCDAFNCIVGSLSVATAVCAGPTWKTWTTLIIAVIVFFMNTLEEYYSGALILPLINGPNEGILIAIAIYFTTAVVGPAWWAENTLRVAAAALPAALRREAVGAALAGAALPDAAAAQLQRAVANVYEQGTGDVVLCYNTLAVLFMLSAGVVTCLGNVVNVYRAVSGSDASGHGKYGSGFLLRRFPFVHAMTRLLPLAVISVLANAWFLLSPDNIFRQHPRLFCWTVGLLYTKLSVHLMIAHLCSVEFHPFRRTLVPFIFFAAHIAFSYANRGEVPVFDEELLLYEFFVLSVTTFAHLAINAIVDTKNALGIRIFHIPAGKKTN